MAYGLYLLREDGTKLLQENGDRILLESSATKFLEPGSDATFTVVANSGAGFWDIVSGAPASVSDFVHGTHQRSIQCRPNNADVLFTTNLADSGTRISMYVYLVAYPASNRTLWDTNSAEFSLGISTTGVLSFKGTSGSTLALNTWYRISMAYTVTSSTVNEFRIFVNGVQDITKSNQVLSATGSTQLRFGNISTDTTYDVRFSDIYIDGLASLTDPGDIWVTAKRPFANGALNEFTTQIGAGGSGYGSGHSPQVNERPLSNTNGWSIQNAALKTEEYTIEGLSTGDFDLTTATLIDYIGWIDAKVGSNSTGNIIVNGVTSNISVTTTEKIFTKKTTSSTYPSGTSAIGIDNNAVNQLFSLYECGVLVAFIPSSSSHNNLLLLGVG